MLHIKKKMGKLTLALLVANTLSTGIIGNTGITGNTATASASSIDGDVSFSDALTPSDFSSIINKVDTILEGNLIINDSGIHIFNEEKAAEELSSLDLSPIQNEMQKNGTIFETDLTPSDLIEMYNEYISETNIEIEEGSLIVLEEGTIVENDDTFSLQANVTKDVKYWWGKRRFKSTANARKWAANIRAAGHVNAAAGIGLAIFGGAAGYSKRSNRCLWLQSS